MSVGVSGLAIMRAKLLTNEDNKRMAWHSLPRLDKKSDLLDWQGYSSPYKLTSLTVNNDCCSHTPTHTHARMHTRTHITWTIYCRDEMGRVDRGWESTSVSNESLKITVILYSSLIQAHSERGYSETRGDGATTVKTASEVCLRAELDRKHC